MYNSCEQEFNLYVKKIFFSFFCMIGLLQDGCKNEASQEYIEKTTPYISLNLKKSNENIIQNFNTFFDVIKLIQLKNKNGLLNIGALKKAIYYNKNFYLFDIDFAKLYCYDSSGNFITQFGEIGLGKGEFRGISDFDIAPEKDNIGLFSNDDQSIFYYSIHNGTFQKRRKLGVYGSSIAFLPNDSILLYINNNYNNKSGKWNLLLLDSNSSIVKRFFPFNMKQTAFFTMTGFLSKSSNKQIFFSPSFEENVYVFNGSTIKNTMHASINSSNIDEKKTDPRGTIKEKVFLDSSTSFLGATFLRNDRHIVGSYQHTLRREFFLYNIAEQKVDILSKRNISDALIQIIDCPLFIGPDDTIIFSIFPIDVFRLKKTNKELFKSLISNPHFAKLDSLKPNSSPYLLIAKLKH